MELIRLGTACLDDGALVEEFESCRLAAAQFHHADHIRLAWIYLGRMKEEAATVRIEQAIRRFAAHNGVSEKYHHTITVAWMRLVAAARRETPAECAFEEFSMHHPELFDAKALRLYYSAERPASVEARTGWVAPDRFELPLGGNFTA